MQELSVEDIKSLIPHRYPFLLVDKIIKLEIEKEIIGIKNVTFNEPYFSGHFPEQSVMPGVLIIESMAQVSGILAVKSMEKNNKNSYLIGINEAKFRNLVVPGDTLTITSTLVRKNKMAGTFKCEAKVADKICAQANLSLCWN